MNFAGLELCQQSWALIKNNHDNSDNYKEKKKHGLIKIDLSRIELFYVSSSAVNCQLTALDVDQTLSTDITTDSAWNIYEREFNSACDDDINGGNGGGGGIQGQGGF